MGNLGLENLLQFDEFAVTAPEIVIANVAKQVKASTKHYVTAIVKPYEGEIESFSTTQVLSQALTHTVERFHSVQDKLGELNNSKQAYEFYLTSPTIPTYKYRMLFLEHSILNYPAKFVLEDSIADELFPTASTDNTVVICHSKEEVEALLLKVIRSQTVLNVMQSLIRFAQQKERITKELEVNTPDTN